MLFLPALSAIFLLDRVAAGLADNEHDSANHIFNAIHSSMRQWGSSLNHNGMSYFLATVPEGTHFYHGRATNETVTGMEWVAFEPEHALSFAHPPHKRPPFELAPLEPGPGPTVKDDALLDTTGSGHSTLQRVATPITDQANPEGLQQPLSEQTKDEKAVHGGFLHTLEAKRDLRLLYIDGMAAGKSNKGTLDSTDYVLLNRSTDDDWLGGPVAGDYARAVALCDLAQNRWQRRIDGFIRMEAGFEIIVCSFEDTMTTLSMRRTNPTDKPHFWTSSFGAYMQAVASRYDGIGGHRVAVNFETMVTAYDYSLDLYAGGKYPRLRDTDQRTRSNIRADVEGLILRKNLPPRDWLDWQAVADMIVWRWGKKITYLHSYNFTSLEDLQIELGQMYRPYIDFDHRSAAAEIRQCASHFMPYKYYDSVASSAVSTVVKKICHSLHMVLQQNEMAAAKDRLADLIDYLQWPSWKRCTGCKDEEVCFVPIWPFGTTQDHETPSCLTASDMWQRHGYWELPKREPPGLHWWNSASDSYESTHRGAR